MTNMDDLLNLIDEFKSAAAIESDGALSARIFNDGKKIGALRNGADITLGRARRCIGWMAENWPADKPRPDALVTANERGAA